MGGTTTQPKGHSANENSHTIYQSSMNLLLCLLLQQG